jgi:hypothetical protein
VKEYKYPDDASPIVSRCTVSPPPPCPRPPPAPQLCCACSSFRLASTPSPSPSCAVLCCDLQAPLSEEQQQQQLAGSKRAAPDNDYNFISQWLRGEPEGVYGVSVRGWGRDVRRGGMVVLIFGGGPAPDKGVWGDCEGGGRRVV